MIHNINPLDRISQRLSSVSITLMSIACIITGMLFYMQVWQSESFFTRSTKNFLRHESINSLRGAILDCHGVRLATNRPVTTLTWHGSGNKTWSDEQRILLTALETITQTAITDNAELLLCEKRGRNYIISCDVPFEQLSKIFEQIPTHPNIVITTNYARLYPLGTLACHILGYFRETADTTNTSGLEQLFEEQLRGTPGIAERTINSVGKSLKLREINKALNGQNIVTTIDFDLQKIAESIFPEGESGAFIVMDPHNGALRVLMSRPDFDPNIFLKPVTPEEWAKLQAEKPFINRCMCANYPPASLFKLITTTAGIEEGIITSEKSWFCNGQIEFGGRPYLCNRHETGGHGNIKNMEEALALSCNIPFYEIGKRISIDTLAGYAKKYGLGQETGIIFPEKIGLIPTSAWKKRVYGEPWWQGETLNCAIGQGPFLVTPLQMARFMGSICTGILVRPRILEDEPIDIQSLKVSHHTLKFLRQALRMTISMGTGNIMNKMKNMTIHAKTGTAQTCHRSKRDLGKQYWEHAWFVSCSQYKNYDPIVLVIFIEHAGSAKFATRVAKKFFIEYCKLMEEKEKS
jgi:penicillin-binding protein 2